MGNLYKPFNILPLLLRKGIPQLSLTQVATMKHFPIPEDYSHIELPEKTKLKMVDKVPQNIPGTKIQKGTKKLIDIRGPELVHNRLIHKQYGIMALTGGMLKYGHFEMIRRAVYNKMDSNNMFAVWRVDPPWKPVTRKGQGKRMGGGKGHIDHYATPIKAGRIIMEIAGRGDFEMAFPVLRVIQQKLPFQAVVVSQKILEEQLRIKEKNMKANENPYSMKYIIQNNIQGCHIWISPYDKEWFGQFV